MNVKKMLCMAFLAVCSVLWMIACSNFFPQPTEDTSYLRPIPMATVFAFKSEGPIDTKVQAAIFALSNSMGGHFGFIELPTVISVDKLDINEAHKRIDAPETTPFDDKGFKTEIWFVVLEGEIQVIPPPSPEGVTATPLPPFHGCNYVMFDPNPGGIGIGGIPCPTKTP